MKTFNELNKTQQTKAIQLAVNSLLEGIIEGALRFNDELNQNNLQARIDKALAKAERLQTPWFASEILMEDKTVKQAIEGMAQCDAEDALYSEPSERVISNVVTLEDSTLKAGGAK
jgi:hypothetical protein